jgi:hypothetical protein
LAVALVLAWSAWADAQVEVDATRIYRGDPATFKAPAVIVARDVFAVIPAYQEIQQRALSQKDAEFWVLMERADRMFKVVLTRLTEQQGHDLIGERGAILIDGNEPVDRTSVAKEHVAAIVAEQHTPSGDGDR